MRLVDSRPRVELVPPMSKEFRVYGGEETVQLARRWALDNHYLLVRGVPACAHGIYMMHQCPGNCEKISQLDHVNLWVTSRGRPFLLSHPYASEIDAEIVRYADAHGLLITSDLYGDGWYGRGSIAIRVDVPYSWPVWPIEAVACQILAVYPIRWEHQEQTQE